MPECSQGSPYPVPDSISGDRVANQRHNSLSRPYRRRGGNHQATGLFAMPPRLELPADAYAGVPCWWSRRRWLAHCEASYEAHYTRLRELGLVESVSLRAFLAVMTDMAAGADHTTGRGCRVPVGRKHRDGHTTGLVASTGRSERTVQRARALARALGLVTDVLTGRLRTLIERLDSWRRGDRSRGWCTVSALHPTRRTDLPVDNSRVAELLEDRFGTPPSRREVSLKPSPESVVTTDQNMNRRGPSGRSDKKRWGKRAAAFDPKALVLASQVSRDGRMPAWVRRHGAKAWAAPLTRYARAGWTSDDVYEALRDYTLGHQLRGQPHNPYGYLAHILSHTDIDAPPAALIRAQAQADDVARRQQQAVRRADIARRNSCAAAPDSSAIAQARAVASAAASRRTHRRPTW